MSSSASEIAAAGRPPLAATRGSIAEVMGLAWPVLIQTVAETVMTLIDSAMVGRLGAAQLGAVGFASIWVWTAYAPFSGAASGVQTFVSQSDGAGERERCGAWVWQALWPLLPAVCLWSGVLAIALPALFEWIAPSPELLAAAHAYVLARLPGAPASIAMFAAMSFFRGIGDTRTPLYAVAAALLTNGVLGYGLIFGALGLPQLGVMGAGLAFSAGSWVMAAVIFTALLRRPVRERYRTQLVAPRLTQIARLLRTAAPVGGQWTLDLISFALFTSIVARMGDAAMAASQAMLQLLSISFMQAVAIGIATGTLVGRALGARDPDAAQRSFRSGQALALGMAALVAGLFLGVPELLIGVFSREEPVLALARPLLALGALFQGIDAIGILTNHALRGAGDTRWPFLVQALLAWVLRLPVVWALAIWLEGGVFGAWLGELIYVLGISLALLWRFHSGRWRAMRI